MAAGPAETVVFQVDLGQADLRLFRNNSGQFSEIAQLAEHLPGVVIAPKFLESAAHCQQAIREVELRAHGAASMQRVRGMCVYSATGDYNQPGGGRKMNLRQILCVSVVGILDYPITTRGRRSGLGSSL
jgi:hypothetical protein